MVRRVHYGEGWDKLRLVPTGYGQDLREWVTEDRLTVLRILDLLEAIARDPFPGIGKSEPLRHFAPGTWLRRITAEHRLVYLVRQETIDLLTCRDHY